MAGQGAPLSAIGGVGLTVSDMERSLGFYTRALSFEKVSDNEVDGEPSERLTGVFGVRMRVVRLRLGNEFLELTEFLAAEGRPAPVDSHSNDLWFQHVAIIVSDMDSAYRVLRAHHARHASSGPQRLPDWNMSAGGIRAFYFKDPDGHPLEVLWFPAGKGDPKWHQNSKRLFLGIDHTAIAVRDTERSLKFYRDLLGMRVAGESRNYGTEQAHLNNVEGASLRITGLRLAAGPGIEFLEYLTPRGGRPIPEDERPNDLVHWHTIGLTDGGSETLNRLASSGIPVVSKDVTPLPSGWPDYSRGVLVRDPDGHELLLVDAKKGSKPDVDHVSANQR